MTELRFFVPGIPRPGGSKRVFGIKKGGIYTGRFIVTDAAGQGNKDWRASVAHGAREAMEKNANGPIIPPRLLLGPIHLELLFQMPRPKGHYRSNGLSLRPTAPQFPVSRPDCGKLARSTTDALTGILWRDDSQIVIDHGEKAYSDQPGCWIIVREIE